jgi:hypothetical protein
LVPANRSGAKVMQVTGEKSRGWREHIQAIRATAAEGHPSQPRDFSRSRTIEANRTVIGSRWLLLQANHFGGSSTLARGGAGGGPA